jgi:hypothetical protein
MDEKMASAAPAASVRRSNFIEKTEPLPSGCSVNQALGRFHNVGLLMRKKEIYEPM